MRELTVRIRFTAPCLGNQKLRGGGGQFVFQRNPATKHVIFLPTWHQANMRLAAQLLGRLQDEVARIHWDQHVDGRLRQDKWFRRHYRSKGGKQRYVLHEAFFPGQEIGINLCLPATVSEDDFIKLMAKAGQYRGLSPWKPGEYGFYEVVSVRERQAPQPPDDGGRSQQAKLEAEYEEKLGCKQT
jgi:hypothetical protein